MFGACVRRARLQAADGAPMPTKQMSVWRSARAAAIVIISVAVYVILFSLRRRITVLRRLRRLACAHALGMHGERLRSLVQHVCLHPAQEGVALARDLVPGDVEAVVTRIIAVRVGRMGAARHAGDGADGPAR